MLPWAVATAAGGAAIALAAGGGGKAAGALLVLGLVFAAFVWAASVARCPSCGAPLPLDGKRPGPGGSGPAGAGGLQGCPRCLAPFE